MLSCRFWMCFAWYLWLQAHMIHSSCECLPCDCTALMHTVNQCQGWSLEICCVQYTPSLPVSIQMCQTAVGFAQGRGHLMFAAQLWSDANRENVMEWNPMKHWACSFTLVYNMCITCTRRRLAQRPRRNHGNSSITWSSTQSVHNSL